MMFGVISLAYDSLGCINNLASIQYWGHSSGLSSRKLISTEIVNYSDISSN